VSGVGAALRAAPGRPVDLGAIDPASTPLAPGDKSATKEATQELRDRLAGLQRRLWAGREHAVLVVLQAMDTGGKDGAVREVFKGVSPLGVHAVAFGAPTEIERGHDFLWRVHTRAPARGEIVVFNRSHYEDVLVVRVKGLVPEERWRGRYGHIRAWERLLADEGTTIVKCMLHISKEEQRERLTKRLERPDKRWKLQRSDLEDRKLWDEYQRAYADAIDETGTEAAPWYVIPADRKWYRDFALGSILVETLERLDPQCPAPAEDLDGVEIPE
jgi:PPK2 family polyphosphate:nucleotide phosphotransferase